MKLSIIVSIIIIFMLSFVVYLLTNDFILVVVIGGLCGVLLALRTRRLKNSENEYEYDSIGIRNYSGSQGKRNKFVVVALLLLILAIPAGLFFFVFNNHGQEGFRISDTLYISTRGGYRYAVRFDGEMKDGYAQGMGVAWFEGGYVVEGEFAYGSIVSGLLTFPDRSTFEGEFYNRRLHYGTRTLPNGNIYRGIL